MRSRFTRKWPPTLIEVLCFTHFAAWNVSQCAAPIAEREFCAEINLENPDFQTNKLGSQVA